MHIKLHYVSKYNKLVQLVVQVQYHMNVIYSPRGRHTHIPTSQTKAISRNQARASLGRHTPGLIIFILENSKLYYNSAVKLIVNTRANTINITLT